MSYEIATWERKRFAQGSNGPILRVLFPFVSRKKEERIKRYTNVPHGSVFRIVLSGQGIERKDPISYSMFRTTHKISVRDSRDVFPLEDQSVDLIVTSPPYPMIEMWNDLFFGFSSEIETSFESDPDLSFERMHQELDKVWKESFRTLKKGGFLVINIGDATRKTVSGFRIFMNHARIIQNCNSLGFFSLPGVLWRKQTNSPNKFMGSGMLPAGAYVTLEHEHILIFRKGDKRNFSTKAEKLARAESAFFWEERNLWFGDVWDFKGKKQGLEAQSGRERSAAYPLELANRIVLMYSLKGDLVLDPFLGTATTTLAAIGNGRNSIGFELDPHLSQNRFRDLVSLKEDLNSISERRISNHESFVENRKAEGKPFLHFNTRLRTPVVTAQEKLLCLDRIETLEQLDENTIRADHVPLSQTESPLHLKPASAVQT